MSDDFKLLAKLAADTTDFDRGMKSAAAESKRWADEAKAIFLSTRTPLEKYQSAVERVHDAWRTGRIDTDTFGRAVTKLKSEMAQFSQEAETAATKLDQFKSLAMKGIGALGIGIGVSTAVSELKQFMAESFREYQEAYAAQQKLVAVLKSTGHAAGFTADQLGDYATQLQRITNYDDDAIQSSLAVLATFKQIQGVQFTQATRAILDVSAVLQQDLQSSAVQVGKALNDPVRGLTALRRVGVSFTTEQEEMIKSFVKANDVISAQKVILAELESEFGGAAENMRSAAIGLGNDWRNLQEAIGSFSDTSTARDSMEALANAVRNLTNTITEARAAAESSSSFGEKIEGLLAARKLIPQLNLSSPLSIFFASDETAKQVEGIQAEMAGAKKQADDLQAAMGRATASRQSTEAAEELSEALAKTTAEMRKQVETFGMSANQIKLWELAQKGATEAELAQIRADAQALEHMEAIKRKADEERAARESLTKSVDDYIKELESEASAVGKTAAEQDLLKFALRGVTDARLKDIEAAQKQAEASKRTAEAVEEFFKLVEALEFNQRQGEEREREQKEIDDLQAEFARIADRHKTTAEKATEQFKAEMKHLNELKEKGLAPDLYIKEFKAINQRHEEGINPGKAAPQSSENRALLRGSSEAFSAMNRANDQKAIQKKAEQIQSDMLRTEQLQLVEQRKMAKAFDNIQQWN